MTCFCYAPSVQREMSHVLFFSQRIHLSSPTRDLARTGPRVEDAPRQLGTSRDGPPVPPTRPTQRRHVRSRTSRCTVVPIHSGIDDINMLGGAANVVPLPLIKDGHLLATIRIVLGYRGLDPVRVSKVKGHADQFLVADGSVQQDDIVGNDGADTDADPGKLRQNDAVINARRAPLQVGRQW